MESWHRPGDLVASAAEFVVNRRQITRIRCQTSSPTPFSDLLDHLFFIVRHSGYTLQNSSYYTLPLSTSTELVSVPQLAFDALCNG